MILQEINIWYTIIEYAFQIDQDDRVIPLDAFRNQYSDYFRKQAALRKSRMSLIYLRLVDRATRDFVDKILADLPDMRPKKINLDAEYLFKNHDQLFRSICQAIQGGYPTPEVYRQRFTLEENSASRALIPDNALRTYPVIPPKYMIYNGRFYSLYKFDMIHGSENLYFCSYECRLNQAGTISTGVVKLWPASEGRVIGSCWLIS